jgi:hypothetical protein
MPTRTTAAADAIAGVGGDLDLEVLITDDGLALLPSEVELLVAARTSEWRPTSASLERLGRLTARQLERLSKAIDEHLDPHDAADKAWRLVSEALADSDDLTETSPPELEQLVNTFVKLDAYAHAHDERVGAGHKQLERTRVALTEAHARRARLERLTAAALEGARKAGGADAFEGRYEELGNALKNLEAQAAKP